MENITFGQAVISDAPVIYELCKETVDKYEDITSFDYDAAMDWVKRKIEKTISQYTRIYKDGELCGYFSFNPDGEKYELDDFYILDGFRGQGIGTYVLEKCLSETDKTVYLYVFKKNTVALNMYIKHGFKPVKDLGTRYIMEKENEVS